MMNLPNATMNHYDYQNIYELFNSDNKFYIK